MGQQLEQLYKIYKNHINHINHIGFLINLGCILFTEFVSYAWNQHTYADFIRGVAQRFAKENILCVKVFQAIALNNNLIDDAMNAELLTFTDSAPYSDEDVDFLLLKNICRDYNLCINLTKPINSGMISLVFLAKMSDGRLVILKMKRRNIEQQLYRACEQFRFLNWVFSLVPMYRNMKLNSTIENILSASILQLNFNKEIENTEDMREACKHLEYVKILEIYKDVTHQYPNVIMMEYIDGKDISRIDPDDYEIYAKQVLKYGFVSAFMGGIAHADLHAGNVLFLKDYKIAPIDFGLVLRMNDMRLRDNIVDIATDLFTCDPEYCAEKMISMFLNPPDLKLTMHEYHYCELVSIISHIVRDTLCKKSSCDQSRIYEFLLKFNVFLQSTSFKSTTSFHLNVEPNEEFMKLQSAIAMANGISVTLCKNNYIGVLNEVLDELFHVNLFMET
jgi:predicted unusual protein kinase regulating ubiquinone biosynthesis (AarF/ABC1/UbiB family)